MEELLGLSRPIFDAICIAPEGPEGPIIYRKPSPRFIRESIERYQLDPAQCWMVGDREADVETGRAGGIRSAGVCTGKLDAAAWQQAFPDVPVFPSFVEFVDFLGRAD
jgi:D-glycero-D-manno-heptose 1,7-bisphosphate phosphatase